MLPKGPSAGWGRVVEPSWGLQMIPYEDVICGSILKLNLRSELYLRDRGASVCNSVLVLRLAFLPKPPITRIYLSSCPILHFLRACVFSICCFFFSEWQRSHFVTKLFIEALAIGRVQGGSDTTRLEKEAGQVKTLETWPPTLA